MINATASQHEAKLSELRRLEGIEFPEIRSANLHKQDSWQVWGQRWPGLILEAAYWPIPAERLSTGTKTLSTSLEWLMFAARCLLGFGTIVSITKFQSEDGQRRHLVFALLLGIANLASHQLDAGWPLLIGLVGLTFFWKVEYDRRTKF
jgi:hypothetical protein